MCGLSISFSGRPNKRLNATALMLPLMMLARGGALSAALDRNWNRYVLEQNLTGRRERPD
jgi:hypothetical protein